jgi:hypothetical protein
MDKFGSISFGFSKAFSILLMVLLVGILVSIIAAIAFGLLPLQGKTGFVVPGVVSVPVLGQDVVLIQHKGGDTFLLNASPSPSSSSIIGFAIKTKNGTENARVPPTLKKYTFAPGDTLCIFHALNGYFVTDDISALKGPAPFANGTYYIIITDETQKTLIMRLGPY